MVMAHYMVIMTICIWTRFGGKENNYNSCCLWWFHTNFFLVLWMRLIMICQYSKNPDQKTEVSPNQDVLMIVWWHHDDNILSCYCQNPDQRTGVHATPDDAVFHALAGDYAQKNPGTRWWWNGDYDSTNYWFFSWYPQRTESASMPRTLLGMRNSSACLKYPFPEGITNGADWYPKVLAMQNYLNMV